MNRLSDNYYHRKCYLERDQVPTQTVMKDKMSVSLAKVYFKSMTPKLKVLAGLEPSMQGGGTEWFMPPEELLAGRAVLKPVLKRFLDKLGFNGINQFGEKLRENHYRAMLKEKKKALEDSDENWKEAILASNRQQYADCAKHEADVNSQKIQDCVNEFELMYRKSVTKIESLINAAAIKEIERVREDVFQRMKDHYKKLLEYQATQLYDEYHEKLVTEKARLKAQFIEDVESVRTEMGNRLHDIKLDKHLVIEKLRHYLECQSLACQIYVALKEREVCQAEIELSKHEHNKKKKELQDKIATKDFEIQLEIEHALKGQEFNRIWKKKICHIVKKFQLFVEYCLKEMPQHAEFFLNMERLMMLQLGEAAEDPSTPSIIESKHEIKAPVAKPHPFYLFCDKGYKPQPEQNLCPKHCTSSASQIPVVVINKRYFYSACDNFKLFTDKVNEYIYGTKGDDADYEDIHKYEWDVPVKITSEEQLKALKLESSLMQIIQQERPNIQDLPIACGVCKLAHCFCSPIRVSETSVNIPYVPLKTKLSPEDLGPGNTIHTREQELRFIREPKWESYLNFVEPKKCRCAKTAKKHLKEHLPAYMRNMSPFEPAELPNYEPCRLSTLRELVKKARGMRTPQPIPEKQPSKTRDISTQYDDYSFETLCKCFSEDEVDKLFSSLLKGSKLYDTKLIQTDLVDGDVTPSYLTKTKSSFATERALSLRTLVDDAPELEEIFRKTDCNF